MRIDLYLQQNGYYSSRTKAGEGIERGEVLLNGKTVKMIPCDLRKSCSLGVFGYVALENSKDETLLPYVTGDLRNFKGDKSSIDSLEAIKKLLLKK